MEKYYVDFYPINQVPSKLVEIIEKDLADSQITLKSQELYGEIYRNQLYYINKNYPESYFVAAYQSVSNVYLGGVILFLNTKPDGIRIIRAPSPAFQEIAKSQDGLSSSFKLNSLLIPAIIDFLKPLGYHEVYVNPVGRQREFLLKYYQFEPFYPDYPTDIKLNPDLVLTILMSDGMILQPDEVLVRLL